MRNRSLVLLLALGLSAGCSSGRSDGPAPTAAHRAAVAAAPSPTTKPVGLTDPLTGRAVAALGPVIAVKIDNGVLARPYQRGLSQAALVFQEVTEGGTTRFAAIYDRASVTEIGPIRSIRQTDFDLLRPFGQIAVAFSGGNPPMLRAFRGSVRAGQALDASYDAFPHMYRLGERRRDARNFFTSPAKVVAAQPRTARAQDVGFRFGALAPSAGTRAIAASMRFSKDSVVTVQYVASTGRYAIRQDGRLMRNVAPENIVVQRVQTRLTKLHDTKFKRTPYTETVGRGDAVVLRDGKQVPGTWRRPDVGSGTRLVDAVGRDIPLHVGQTWVLLVPAGEPVTFS